MWRRLTFFPRHVNHPPIFFCNSPDLHQTSDRTARIREAVARYEGFEFVSVRIQDAFDRSWWERVSGNATHSPPELLINLSIGGSFHVFFEGVIQTIDIPIRFQANCCFEGTSQRHAHPYGYSLYSLYPNEVAIVIYCLFYWCLSSGPGHVSYFIVDILDLLDISRWRLCRATGNTRRMDSAFYQMHSWNRIVERRGPLNPTTERRWHEGMRCLGLVASADGGREAENSYLRADH